MVEFEVFRKDPAESFNQYLLRTNKIRLENKMSYTEYALKVNTMLHLNYSDSSYRKKIRKLLEDQAAANADPDPSAEDTLFSIRKAIVADREERNLTNTYIRRLSREDTIKDIASDIASKFNLTSMLPESKPFPERSTGNKAILCLSDWHYGIEINNNWNVYNTEIAKQRVAKLRDAVLHYIDFWDINELYVLNLADLIAGRIHLQLRLDSRIDVLTQIMQVSEILAEFLSVLATKVNIKYYDCLDNHSRLEPNKADSWDLESLARITPWFLKERLTDRNVEFPENKFGNDIITCKIFDFNIAGVHGDKDSPAQVADNLSMMTEQHFDLICTAHRHHYSADEKNRTMIISNASLMGTDSYAQKLRLSSQPSQNLIIISKTNVTEAVHRIVVD